MQATIRLEGGQGRDRGVIVVREAPDFSGPIFFTLQRFPDGKYLSADSLWRSARDSFRSSDYRQKAGTLSIPIGADILYELDSDTSYRMSINDGASFALCVERKVFTALQGKAALEEYQKIHQSRAQRGEDDDDTTLSVRSARHGLRWRAILIPLLALVLCVGLVVRHFSRDQIFPLQDEAISLGSTPMDGQEKAGSDTRNVKVTTQENVARLMPQTSYFSFDNGSSSLEDIGAPGNQSALPNETGEAGSFSHTVSSYLQSSYVSSDINVLLAKRVRVEGASPEETDTAFELLQDAANDGNTEAMYMLAQYYDPLSPLPHGSVEQDPCLAREWYTRAQEGGLAKAAISCDELKNYIARKAAQGDRKAQNILRYW